MKKKITKFRTEQFFHLERGTYVRNDICDKRIRKFREFPFVYFFRQYFFPSENKLNLAEEVQYFFGENI